MLEYIFLGFIQGAAEFLPISSSGHLVILKDLFAVKGDNLILNIILHLGTLIAILIFFRNDIINSIRDFALLKKIAVTTIVTAAIAILFKNFFESLFNATAVAAPGLAITGAVLLSVSRKMDGRKKINDLSLLDAVIVGLFQAVAITPGISRSGLTISAQLWRNIERDTSFRYSFFAAVPAILGAIIMEFPRLKYISDINPFSIGAGFLAAVFTGFISLKVLRMVILKTKFSLFGYYCLFIALLTLLLR